jgi:F0F1-type ATP synthase assembly protein I
MNKPQLAKFKGYFAANVVAFVLIGLNKLLLDDANVFIYAEFVIIPMLMGVMYTWFMRKYRQSSFELVAASCIIGIVAIVLSALFLKEGAICLLIVSPLLLSFILLGALLGRYMFRRNNNTLNVSLISLMLLAFVADSLSTHHYENEVTDTITINAPPAEVWKYVVAYKRNTSPNKYWLFKAGMPSPIESTAEGYYLGAKRKCIFSNGYVFDEKIVTYDEDKNLTFDITHQPRDPEIMGHIDILRGQFLLKDNGNNTTTLIGSSWYRLYVFPVWYYDIWAQSITRNVHLRVMEHIKQLSETK